MPINFDAPQVIVQPAVKLDITTITFTDTDIRVSFQYTDTNDTPVKHSSLNISGQDYTDIVTTLIETNHVGKKISKIFKKTIMQKIKVMLNIAGTVAE
jgi:hypothetical protein